MATFTVVASSGLIAFNSVLNPHLLSAASSVYPVLPHHLFSGIGLGVFVLPLIALLFVFDLILPQSLLEITVFYPILTGVGTDPHHKEMSGIPPPFMRSAPSLEMKPMRNEVPMPLIVSAI